MEEIPGRLQLRMELELRGLWGPQTGVDERGPNREGVAL